MTNLKPIDFMDPGADDNEPTRSVTNGHLRQWHDAFHDMEERYHAEHRTVARIWEALGISTFEQAGGLAIFEIVARQKAALERVHHTLTVHGHIDAYTGLHATVQTALDPTASWYEPTPVTECHSSQADPAVTTGAAGGSPALEQKLIRVHSAIDDALGDSDVTHIEDDSELRRQYPMQWAAEQLAKIIDDL